MKNALIVHGGWEGHDPKGVAKLFKEILEGEDFSVTVSDTLDAFLGDLSIYDLLIPIWTMGTISREAEQNVCRAVAAGTGMAGCHGGMCDAFRNSTEWQFMTGSQWVAHPGNSDAEYTVNIKKSASDPIIQGIEDFSVKSEQYYIHVDPAVNVLATTRFPTANGNHTTNGQVDVPVVYTKRWGKGKIFYNSLGHTSEIFKIPEAKELMRRGFLYAAR
ncbi:MAG: ThuA domain-containing protein [Clostridia bacterium]|nr:ThuA domain-containing protein [Clostridia bacterium]